MYNLIQKHKLEHFGNDWGFYADIEETSSNNEGKFDLNQKKYGNKLDKIHEDLKYYESNNKKEKDTKKIEEELKNNSSSLLFNISSIALFTAAISYCFS
jgi:hypothetical protein